MVVGTDLANAFSHRSYLFRRKLFKLFGGAFYVYDENGNLVFFTKQKAFRLREDFRVYADEDENRLLLIIKTPQILDLGATYNVEDATSGELVGALRRKAFISIIKDEWSFLSKDGIEIGKLTEKNLLFALLARFVNLFPQVYTITTTDGREIATINQHFNPFVLKYTMKIVEPLIDPRLLISAGILLAGIERRQQKG